MHTQIAKKPVQFTIIQLEKKHTWQKLHACEHTHLSMHTCINLPRPRSLFSMYALILEGKEATTLQIEKKFRLLFVV